MAKLKFDYFLNKHETMLAALEYSLVITRIIKFLTKFKTEKSLCIVAFSAERFEAS
jgi:hypothetical protein